MRSSGSISHVAKSITRYGIGMAVVRRKIRLKCEPEPEGALAGGAGAFERRNTMITKIVVSAFALASVLSFTGPAFAQDHMIDGKPVPADQVEAVQAKCDELRAAVSGDAAAGAEAPAADATARPQMPRRLPMPRPVPITDTAADPAGHAEPGHCHDRCIDRNRDRSRDPDHCHVRRGGIHRIHAVVGRGCRLAARGGTSDGWLSGGLDPLPSRTQLRIAANAASLVSI